MTAEINVTSINLAGKYIKYGMAQRVITFEKELHITNLSPKIAEQIIRKDILGFSQNTH